MSPDTNRAPERIPTPSREDFYRQHGRREQPVLLSDGMRGWRALERWSFDWFKATHGHVVVPINTGRYERDTPERDSAFARDPARLTLASYLDALTGSNGRPPGYLSGMNLLEYIPSLTEDIAFPRYDSSPRLTRTALWLSAAGTVTQLHFDRTHNLFGQVVGRKRFQLYSPLHSSRLFPVPIEGNANVSVSELELEHTSEERRRQAAQVPPDFDFELSPGELLFLPYGWWHRVTSVTDSISINLWWWTKPMVLSRGPDLLKTSLTLAARGAVRKLRARG